MKAGSFIFDKVKSETIKTHLTTIPEITHAQRKFTTDSGDGINGDRIFDKNSYTNGSIKLNLGAFSNDIDLINYTFDRAEYTPLQIYSDEDFFYYVKLVNNVEWKRESRNDSYFTADFEFTTLPFKKLKNSPLKTLTAAGEIENPCFYPAFSNFKVYGSGTVNFKVNTTTVKITGLQNWIELDADLEDAYQYDRGLYIDKNENIPLEQEFPVLKSGKNTISWTGNVIKVEIEPRWQNLV